MKYLRVTAVLLLTALLIALGQGTSKAAINPMISFQGKLTNTDGTNVNDGNYSIRFRIYTDPSADTGSCANTCKWEETHGTVSVAGGIFHVNLGSAGSTLPGTVDFNGSALYLGVKVSTDAEMTPRVRLTATPYAFNSDTLDGLDSSVFVQLTGGNINIGSGTVTSGAVNGISIGSTIQPSAAGALVVRSNGSNALTLTGGAASTWDIGNNLLSLQTTNNGPVTTGSGLWTHGGNVTFSGASARTITGPSTGGLTVTVGSGPLALSTTTSGALSIASAGALSLSGGAASTLNVGANTLAVTSSNFTVSTAGAITAATSTNTINNLVINNGSLTNVGANITASAALTVASGGSSTLAFDSASNTIQIAANDTTIQRAASGTFTFDLNNAAATTLTVTNSNGAAVANMTVEGDITASGVFRQGANVGANTTCSGGQFLQNPVVSGGLITGGTCVSASGAPGGSDGQVQFNNSGNFGGEADFAWNSSTNTLTLGGSNTGVVIQGVTNEPSTPSAGTLRIYTKDIAGRIMPKWVGPSGVDTPFQAGLGFNRISMVTPAGGTNCSTGVSAIGTVVTGAGTCTNPTPTTTNLLNSTRRITYSSGTTAGTVAYHRQGMLQVWRGNASGLGGFFYTTRFATPTLASGNRAFSGLADSISNPTNVDPTTNTTPGKIGMAINANTGNWSLVHNASGTAPTVIALGANFPVDTTSMYELVLFSAPNGSTIGYRVTNVSTGNQTSGTLSTNIPSNTTFLAPLFWITNNATAAAAIIASSGWYLESDF